VLFYHLPLLPGVRNKPENFPSISVIIPARNEEKSLLLLLKDLNAQSVPAFEIICVDDASEDATAQTALCFGVRLLSVHDKPKGWTGKSWACQKGAKAAKGDVLLFLDADVRLGKDGLRRLVQAYSDCGCIVSVQPYHQTEKSYEQFSLMFNLVQIAANGSALPKPVNIGLCGPVMLISQADYALAGGHKVARNSVIEDLALGMELKKAGIPYQLFMGDADISYRMYCGGLGSLLQGWVKNLASGGSQNVLAGAFDGFLLDYLAHIRSLPSRHVCPYSQHTMANGLRGIVRGLDPHPYYPYPPHRSLSTLGNYLLSHSDACALGCVYGFAV
jgi:4,4'-diaponeurosporenoate glycosyltransferase